MTIQVVVLRSLVFLTVLVAGDYIIGTCLRHYYFTQNAGQSSCLTYGLERCEADILILGNSRAQHHYDPSIVSDSTGLSSYNAGLDGGHSILLPYAQILAVFKRYTPKLVLIEFSEYAMAAKEEDHDKLSVLLPYYRTHPELRPLILTRGQWERIKLLSHIYPFNSQIVNIVRFNTQMDAGRRWERDGFIPIREKVLNGVTARIPTEFDEPKQDAIDPDKLKALEYIIRICEQRQVALIFINSPIYQLASQKVKKQTRSSRVVDSLFARTKVAYFDCSQSLTICHTDTLFADRLHLNENGSRAFSRVVARIVKTKLKPSPLAGP